MLAGLLARAGVTQPEAAWANGLLDRLRAAALMPGNPPKPSPGAVSAPTSQRIPLRQESDPAQPKRVPSSA